MMDHCVVSLRWAWTRPWCRWMLLQYRRTPLQLASASGTLYAVRVLAECKADLEANDEVAVCHVNA